MAGPVSLRILWAQRELCLDIPNLTPTTLNQCSKITEQLRWFGKTQNRKLSERCGFRILPLTLAFRDTAYTAWGKLSIFRFHLMKQNSKVVRWNYLLIVHRSLNQDRNLFLSLLDSCFYRHLLSIDKSLETLDRSLETSAKACILTGKPAHHQ